MRCLLLLAAVAAAPLALPAVAPAVAPTSSASLSMDTGLIGLRARVDDGRLVRGTILTTVRHTKRATLAVTACRRDAGRLHCATTRRALTLRPGTGAVREFVVRLPLARARGVRIVVLRRRAAVAILRLGPAAVDGRVAGRFGIRAEGGGPLAVRRVEVRATAGGAVGVTVTVSGDAGRPGRAELVASSSCGARTCPVAHAAIEVGGEDLVASGALRPSPRPPGAGRLRLRGEARPEGPALAGDDPAVRGDLVFAELPREAAD